MTTEQRTKKAEQLRIAAQIIETGCEWEFISYEGIWVCAGVTDNPVQRVELQSLIRVKPTPAWKLPDPPEGRKWHREDWTQEMLPDGWRPLLYGEIPQGGDEGFDGSAWKTDWVAIGEPLVNDGNTYSLHRTRRPLPQPVISIPEGYRELSDDEKDGRWIEGAKWRTESGKWDCICTRDEKFGCFAADKQHIIVPLPKPRVPLEPGDVPPGSVVRSKSHSKALWTLIVCVNRDGFAYSNRHGEIVSIGWSDALEILEIKRPTDTEWQPCSKPAP